MLKGDINTFTGYEGLMVELDSSGAVTNARVYNYWDSTYRATSMACTIGTGKIYMLLYTYK